MGSKVPGSEDEQIRLRRLHMRSWRRGMKEMDLILGTFANTELKNLSAVELDAHEVLMDEADQDIYAWINGTVPVPERLSDPIGRILASLPTRLV